MILFMFLFTFILIEFSFLTPVDTLNLAVECSPSYSSIYSTNFSIMGAVRSWPEFLYLLTTNGFYHTVCISTMYKGVSGFWTYLFVMSKLIELGR